jgi:hypothetical protein
MDGSTRGSSSFNVPALSLASQSLGIYGGKILHGWLFIIRSLGPLMRRFIFQKRTRV